MIDKKIISIIQYLVAFMVKGFHPSPNLKLEWFIPLYLLFQTKRSVKIKIGWSIDTESHSQSLKITLYIDSFI